ncbi:MAG: hypothetical protein WC520_01335 [Candidatus Paceibacterota bacterium]
MNKLFLAIIFYIIAFVVVLFLGCKMPFDFLILETLLFFIFLIILGLTMRLKKNIIFKLFICIFAFLPLLFLFLTSNMSGGGCGRMHGTNDARIKSEMDQLRSTAEVYRMTKGGETSYGEPGINVQNATGTVNFTAQRYAEGDQLYDDIVSSEVGGKSFVLNIAPDGKAYCISVKTNISGIVCMDSAGKLGTIACGIAINCP